MALPVMIAQTPLLRTTHCQAITSMSRLRTIGLLALGVMRDQLQSPERPLGVVCIDGNLSPPFHNLSLCELA
jgi:hypothetical protein